MLELFIPDDAVEHLQTLQTQLKPCRWMNHQTLIKTLIFFQQVVLL